MYTTMAENNNNRNKLPITILFNNFSNSKPNGNLLVDFVAVVPAMRFICDAEESEQFYFHLQDEILIEFEVCNGGNERSMRQVQ